MDSGGVDGGGDIHEFEAKRACGKREIADITNESNIGVVDGDVQIGLIAEAGGLVAGGRASGVPFLCSVNFVAMDGRIENRRSGGENYYSGNPPYPARGCRGF